MSNHQNRNNNTPNGGNGNGAAGNPAPKQKEKTSFVGKILHIRDKVMESKTGRIIVKGLKIAGVGAVAFGSFKAGERHVKPTTIYIKEGVTEEEKPVETQETVNEETGEVTE